MTTILGMDGQPISTVGARSNKGKITQAQASAIIVSEMDMAIANWNENAEKVNLANPKAAPILSLNFEKIPYAKEVAEKTGYFGYGLLTFAVTRDGQRHEFYRRAVNCKTERDMENVNGYFPTMSYDLSTFLFQSGFMYNLAMLDVQQNPKDYETQEVIQPETDSQSKPGPKRKRGTGS